MVECLAEADMEASEAKTLVGMDLPAAASTVMGADLGEIRLDSRIQAVGEIGSRNTTSTTMVLHLLLADGERERLRQNL